MSSLVTETAGVGARRATPVDMPELAATLSAAFLDDPVMSWCYPDRFGRGRLLPELFSVVLEAYLDSGGVYVATNGRAGSVWGPPDAEVDEERLVGDLVEASAGNEGRMLTLFELLDAAHPQAEPHQYLFLLGTHPEWQGRGLGSALLRAVLTGCDRDGMGAYLEATSARNRRLYERHGFAVTEEVRLPDGGPRLWCMWRAPVPGQHANARHDAATAARASVQASSS